jgi:hypothetical protein
VEGLAESAFYADEAVAVRFAVKHVYPAWRAAKAGASAEILGSGGSGGAGLLVLHLFARAVLGVGGPSDPAPRLVTWRPSGTRGTGGAPVRYRVIATADIARIVHRSESGVRRALQRFKDHADGHGGAALCNVLSMPTGVAVDGMLSSATRHPYMYGVHEYAEARAYAQTCKQRSRRFTTRQTRWCDGAMP